MLLLQVANYGIGAIAVISAIFSLATGLSVFLVARTMYKSTLPTKQAEQWKANYDAEKVRGDNLQKSNTELLERQAKLDREHGLIALEFSQLSQLFAKKSIILEALTGEYGHLADLAEAGELVEYLKSKRRPVTDDDIHTTRERGKKG